MYKILYMLGLILVHCEKVGHAVGNACQETEEQSW